ncbi:hypothetical protein EBX31_07260, partial [bacterium]|nr:hypothetical protein [bacterium]
MIPTDAANGRAGGSADLDDCAEAGFGHQMIHRKRTATRISSTACGSCTRIIAEEAIFGAVVQGNIHDSSAAAADHFGRVAGIYSICVITGGARVGGGG